MFFFVDCYLSKIKQYKAYRRLIIVVNNKNVTKTLPMKIPPPFYEVDSIAFFTNVSRSFVPFFWRNDTKKCVFTNDGGLRLFVTQIYLNFRLNGQVPKKISPVVYLYYPLSVVELVLTLVNLLISNIFMMRHTIYVW